MCALMTDGSVQCQSWSGASNPSEGQFMMVSAGNTHTCGLNADGSIICWGRDDNGELNAPEGTFASVNAGWHIACVLREDDTAAFWGAVGWAR